MHLLVLWRNFWIRRGDDRRALEATDRIARGYTDALRLLQQTADGKFSLGAEDVVANDQLDARFECAPSVFSRRQLGAYR